MTERRYIPCWCYCPFCRRRHRGCMPEDIVQALHKASERSPKKEGRWDGGHRAEYRIVARHLPKVECHQCTVMRAGLTAAEEIARCEANLMARSREGVK